MAERNTIKNNLKCTLYKAIPHRAWGILKSLIDRDNKNLKQKLCEFLASNQLTTDDDIIVNAFNDYFINVGNSLLASIISNVDPLSYVDMCIECITDPFVTVDDVMSVISQLNNSAAGHDGLPASIMNKTYARRTRSFFRARM